LDNIQIVLSKFQRNVIILTFKIYNLVLQEKFH